MKRGNAVATSIDLKKLRDEILAEQLEEMKPAQEAAGAASSRAGWGRVASNVAGAFGGYKPDTGFWDNMEARGQRGVADARAKAGLKQAAMGEARVIADSQKSAQKEADENDPNSAQSAADAELAGRLTGKADLFKGMSTAQMKKAAPFLKEYFEAEQVKRSAKDKLDAEERAEGRWQNHNRITSDQEDARARLNAGAKAGERIENDVKDFSKQLPEGAGQFYKQYDLIKGMLNKVPKGGDVPGVGPIDSRAPSWMLSKEGLDMQKNAEQLMLAYQKLVTGTGGGAKELDRIARAGADLKNEASFARGLESLKEGYDARLKQIQAGYRPEVVKTYNDRNPAFVPPPEAPTEGGEIEVITPDGKEATVPAGTDLSLYPGYRRK
jgi:hypothetical protein